jgi:diguanylate cyclase (GGDEF)-like protein
MSDEEKPKTGPSASVVPETMRVAVRKPTLRRIHPPPQAIVEDETTTRVSAVLPAATPWRDRPTLTVMTGLDAGRVLPLDRSEHVLGRGHEADVRLEDAAISRRHARIVRQPDETFAVEDLQSTNGTFVGGRRVDRARLTPGERIQLGPDLVLSFSFADESEQALQRRLFESSTRDMLTGAFNRSHFIERLVAEAAFAHRHESPLALLMVNLDSLTEINQEHGQLAGDTVLRAVAAQASRLVRVEDLFARYGGEVFVVLARATVHADAAALAERIRKAVSDLKLEVLDVELPSTVSIGVASLAEIDPNADPSELIALASQRLDAAKRAGRNRVWSREDDLSTV